MIGLVIALALATVTLFRSRATSVPLVPVSVDSAGISTPATSVAKLASATPKPDIRVHVVGAVRRPGVVALPLGARVVDAIAAAGGLTSIANVADLDLAAPIPDGAQLRIGTSSHPLGEIRSPGDSIESTTSTTSTASASSGGLVDLNSASLEDLDALPGVGPVTAQRIIDWRSKHQRFTSVSQLESVDGIGPKTYAQIAPHVRV